MGDISSEVETVLQQYTGDIADYCRQELPQQNYRAELDKKLAFYRGKASKAAVIVMHSVMNWEGGLPLVKMAGDQCINIAKHYILITNVVLNNKLAAYRILVYVNLFKN